MRAILTVKAGSAYEHLNGHTFEVSELTDRTVDLRGIYPDNPYQAGCFSFGEIIIVDLEAEYRVRESWKDDDHCFDSTRERAKKEIGYLQRYCIANGFEFTITNP